MSLDSNLTFLQSLAANNHKEWMDTNKKWHQTEREKFSNLIVEILALLSARDHRWADIPVKDTLFRINKDIRFSKDKSPYKTNFGASLNLNGRKSGFAGYYIHIADHGSFVGGGIWMPEAANLKKIRQEIDYNWEEFQEIISHPKFIEIYGDLDLHEKLIRPPKGYEETNPGIHYLKLKSFTATQSLANESLKEGQLSNSFLEKMTVLDPFINFLNRALY